MDVRIGVTYTAKEIDVELAADTDRAKLKADIEEALGNEDGVLWMIDSHGRERDMRRANHGRGSGKAVQKSFHLGSPRVF